MLNKRRKTPTVIVGNIKIGSDNPVVVQSMSNTPTSDISKTVSQIKELVEAGSELVRLTINDDDSAKAIPKIQDELKKLNITIPLIGDFHYNGHILLAKYPQSAQVLAKYRINPGNVGRRDKKQDNFKAIIKIAIKYHKPVRIGVNAGSLDPEILQELMDQNAQAKNPKNHKEILFEALIKSALDSAKYARELGLSQDKIILSIKASNLQDMIEVNQRLAQKCDYVLHLGLTEAGAGIKGLVSSSSALAILLQKGIGDTIRISLTPEPGKSRNQEVIACYDLLQSLGLRYFKPQVTSCPGCGRTNSQEFINLADKVRKYIDKNLNQWKQKYFGVEKLHIAVMGCVVNGPGESKNADLGISLPGRGENPIAIVYQEGRLHSQIRDKDLFTPFIQILENYLKKRFKN